MISIDLEPQFDRAETDNQLMNEENDFSFLTNQKQVGLVIVDAL